MEHPDPYHGEVPWDAPCHGTPLPGYPLTDARLLPSMVTAAARVPEARHRFTRLLWDTVGTLTTRHRDIGILPYPVLINTVIEQNVKTGPGLLL